MTRPVTCLQYRSSSVSRAPRPLYARLLASRQQLQQVHQQEQAKALEKRSCAKGAAHHAGAPKGRDLEAHGSGATLERGNAALTLLHFIVFAPFVDLLFAACQHEVHHARELVRHGGIRARRVHPRA